MCHRPQRVSQISQRRLTFYVHGMYIELVSAATIWGLHFDAFIGQWSGFPLVSCYARAFFCWLSNVKCMITLPLGHFNICHEYISARKCISKCRVHDDAILFRPWCVKKPSNCLQGSFDYSFQCVLLIHLGRVAHICVNKLTTIDSDNGLSPGRRQAIIWTNDGILLIGPFGTNFSEILIEI